MTTSSAIASSAVRPRAVVVLLADVEEAQRVAAALDEVRRPDGPLALIAVPPARGLAFFADSERQEKLDRWWAHAIPRDGEPIYLLRHEPGVAAWLPGLDGHFIVAGVSDDEATDYDGLDGVTLVAGASSLDAATAVVSAFERARMFREDAGPRLQHRLGRTPPPASGRFRRARLRPADEVFVSGRSLPPGTHPIPNAPARPPAPPLLPEPAEPAPAPVATSEVEVVRALAETLRRLQKICSAG